MKTVIGVFDTYDGADQAVRNLNSSGFSNENIGIISNEKIVSERVNETNDDNTATTAGTLTGGLAGLVLGVAAITIPGLGPIITAGTLATLLGATAIGAGAGGLLGVLVDLGISEEEANTYVETIKDNGILVTVKTNENATGTVTDILNKTGAKRVNIY